MAVICLCGKSGAQGNLLLFTGKEKSFKTAKVDGRHVIYEPQNKPGKTKKINRLDVFAIQYDDGKEEIVYIPDTTYDDEPMVEEVRSFINGEQFGMNYFNDNPRLRASQLYFGFSSGFIGSLLGVYGAATPLAYALVVDRFGPEQPPAETEGWVEEEFFIAGYEKKMRSKKIKFSLIGGAIGFTVGITTFAAILID